MFEIDLLMVLNSPFISTNFYFDIFFHFLLRSLFDTADVGIHRDNWNQCSRDCKLAL